jgi:hypothetical protein
LSLVGFLRVLAASLYRPPLAGSIGELAMPDHRLGTVLCVADAVVDEPEAVARLDAESLGVVSHGADNTARVVRVVLVP